MYDYVIITHLPAFYKVNLYNELNKKLNIFVVFIAKETNEKRASDFVNLNNANFEYQVLNNKEYQNRSRLKSIMLLSKLLTNKEFKRVLVSGWDLIEFWFVALFVSKKKNCLALESTILESNIKGFRGVIKKIFLSNISTVFASGELHKQLLDALSYKDNIRITKGVGIINRFPVVVKPKEYNKNFLFIGRLSQEKNLETTIKLFNQLPDCTLNIIGVGPLESELKSIANDNIKFYGGVENRTLGNYFSENSFLILPSLSEPWGLVVEEALYYGLPVIVSDRCGASEIVVDGFNGYIINSTLSTLKSIIEHVDSASFARMSLNVRETSIINKDEKQISSYECT